jgi:hypothetical protein
MELEIVQHVINVTVLWVTVEINAKKMNVLAFGQPTPLMHALEFPKEIVLEETLVAVRLVTQGMNVNSPFVSQLMDPFLLFVQVKESVWMSINVLVTQDTLEINVKHQFVSPSYLQILQFVQARELVKLQILVSVLLVMSVNNVKFHW